MDSFYWITKYNERSDGHGKLITSAIIISARNIELIEVTNFSYHDGGCKMLVMYILMINTFEVFNKMYNSNIFLQYLTNILLIIIRYIANTIINSFSF